MISFSMKNSIAALQKKHWKLHKLFYVISMIRLFSVIDRIQSQLQRRKIFMRKMILTVPSPFMLHLNQQPWMLKWSVSRKVTTMLRNLMKRALPETMRWTKKVFTMSKPMRMKKWEVRKSNGTRKKAMKNMESKRRLPVIQMKMEWKFWKFLILTRKKRIKKTSGKKNITLLKKVILLLKNMTNKKMKMKSAMVQMIMKLAETILLILKMVIQANMTARKK